MGGIVSKVGGFVVVWVIGIGALIYFVTGNAETAGAYIGKSTKAGAVAGGAASESAKSFGAWWNEGAAAVANSDSGTATAPGAPEQAEG